MKFSIPALFGMLVLSGVSIGLMAQQSSQASAFEAAVLKPTATQSGDLRRGSCQGIDNKVPFTVPLGRCIYTRLSLKELLTYAYYPTVRAAFQTDQLITGGERWMMDDYYDLEGKAENPSGTTEAQLLAMLQVMLTERFHLRFHHETRELAAYSLTEVKTGTKLKPTPADQGCQGLRAEGKPGLAVTVGNCATSAIIARFLGNQLRTTVMDRTNLTGSYDLRLEWTPSIGGTLPVAADGPEAGPSIFTAVREQLGLQLESQKIPVDTIVIDAAEKPHE